MRTQALPRRRVAMAVVFVATVATVVAMLARRRGWATAAIPVESNGAHRFDRPETRPEEADMVAAFEG